MPLPSSVLEVINYVNNIQYKLLYQEMEESYVSCI